MVTLETQISKKVDCSKQISWEKIHFNKSECLNHTQTTKPKQARQAGEQGR